MRPTVRLVLLMTGGLAIALLPVLVHGALWSVWLASLLCLLLLATADHLLALSPDDLRIEIETPEILYIGAADPARVRLGCNGQETDVDLLLDLGPNLRSRDLRTVPVPADGEAEVELPLLAKRRGTVRIKRVWTRWTGPLGLVSHVVDRDLSLEIPVTPNIRAVRQKALQFFASRQFLSGLKVEQYIGDGSEFESLREFVPGFDTRTIDWKASARHRKILCREFRAERNHQIIFAFDTGRLMGELLSGVPRLDHAINAGLLLAYVSLKAGDRVGLFGFDEQVELVREPVGGTHSFARLQRDLASLDYTTHETNFTLGLTDLLTRLRRRSLVVLFTDFTDTITAELMLENVERLSRRHLVLFVVLKDTPIETIAHREPNSLETLHESVVAYDLLRERRRVLADLQRLGVKCLEGTPEDLSNHLINQYLEIVRREQIG